MRLRNKKTGEIKPWDLVWSDYRIHSFAELNAEWEDYEEPKYYWYITGEGDVIKDHVDDEWAEYRKSIGNYFETKEEAEKAVKKLKAWKRLKDKGLKFNKWTIPEEPKTTHIKLVMEGEMDVPDSPYDLDLLFSREEE